jgi:sugar lactone lactonase YvrE
MRSNDGVAGRFRGRAHRATIGLLVLGVFAACAAGATATAQLSQAGGLPYKVVGKIGKEGKANGQFSGNAYGLATDKAGNVYVADSGNLRIQQFSANGAYSAKYTFAPGENVIDVAVGPTGDVWGTTDVLTQVRRFPNGGGASENLTTPKSSGGIAVDADGNVYVATKGDNVNAVVRFDKAASGWAPAKTWVGGGLQSPGDVEVSSDGTIYVADTRGAPPNVKRYDASGKLLNTIKLPQPATAGAGALYGIAVDPDCNLWATNGGQRRVERFTPTGKLLGTVTSGDLLSTDMAVGPTGDLYVFDINTRSVIHFAEDRSKPQAALVSGVAVAKKGAGYVARVRYTLSSVACPAQVDATASLAGKGIAGSAHVKVGAGKTTVIEIPLAKGALAKVAGRTTLATFKIVLKTNGRPTTQTRAVTVRVPRA